MGTGTDHENRVHLLPDPGLGGGAAVAHHGAALHPLEEEPAGGGQPLVDVLLRGAGRPRHQDRTCGAREARGLGREMQN